MTVLALALVFGLLFLLQRRIYNRHWANRLSIALAFSCEETHEGGGAELISTLQNRKALPLPWLTVRYRLSGWLTFASDKAPPTEETKHHSDLFAVGSRERIVRRQSMVCHHRGFFRITACELIANDLFLTRRMRQEQPAGAEILVFPRLIPRPDLTWLLNRIGGDVEVRRFIHFDPLVFRGIREYAPHDDVRFINWRASAKTGGLMVNTYNATVSGAICLLLDAVPRGGLNDAEVLEESIRLCASLSDYFCARGVAVSIRSNGRDGVTETPCAVRPGSGQGHTLSILRALARIDLRLPPEPAVGLLAGPLDPEPLYVFISGNDSDETRDAFLQLREQRRDTIWIWPAFSDTPRKLPAHPGILRWEVATHALAPDETA